MFRRTYGENQAYLAPFSATVARGNGAAAFGNVNLGSVYSQGLGFLDIGNAAFTGPPSKYLLFSFTNTDTSQTNYGWIELTATATGFSSTSQYSATLGDWAYDNSGATILAGQTVPVPEPATAALAMGGALVAGAAGLRRWRKQRAAEAQAGT